MSSSVSNVSPPRMDQYAHYANHNPYTGEFPPTPQIGQHANSTSQIPSQQGPGVRKQRARKPSALDFSESSPSHPSHSNSSPTTSSQGQPSPERVEMPAPTFQHHGRRSSSSTGVSSPSPTPGMMTNHSYSRSQGTLPSMGGPVPQLPPPTRKSFAGRPHSAQSSVSSLDFTSTGLADASSIRRASTSSPALNDMSTSYASASMFDLSQSYLTPHLGQNQQSLMPRIKTIELYRKNAKKSNDPVIQFQFAQYMLQTALLSGTSSRPNSNVGSKPASPNAKKSSKSNPNLNPSGDLSPEEVRLKSELLKEAVANLRKLSDKGFADAQYLLGDAYASGALGKPDLRESFTLFQLAAKHGHGEAAYRAALCLEEGWGTSKDMRRAVQFLRTAAVRNQPGATFRLGMACFYGQMGVGNSVSVKQEGFKWLTRAADAANEIYNQAPYELAKIYEVGYRDLVFKDLQYAVQLYVKSAELHYIPAASKLGHAYEYGTLGCPQDAALSIHYYTVAALAGDANSMLAMCAWYMVGAEPVLPRNEEEAYEWAMRAAQTGLAKAQYAVGYFLENGIGTERDLLESSKWYRMAAAGGDERAIERVKRAKQRQPQKKGDKDKDCVIM
uniref:ARAD1A12474p n=1 Tax=Blastobotrys adeninivorans TaxID=409370 RepID=A0A060T311_BLAAD